MILERVFNLETKDFAFVQPGTYALRTHARVDDCDALGCTIHNRDERAVENREEWPYNWRGDRGFMERICQHGVGHPDLGQIRYWNRTLSFERAHSEYTHGCCGCCGGLRNDTKEES